MQYGYVTSNFIGQLHLQSKFYVLLCLKLHENIDLKWYTLNLLLKLLFKLNKIFAFILLAMNT